MRVSVILCTYSPDMYNHFCEAADSVLSQTHDDTELVVVVDGTEAVYNRATEHYGHRENIIISCNDENIGLLQSRNRGAELATGDVIAFIDDDAVADRDWVDQLIHGYQQEHAIAVGGKMVPKWVAGRPSFLPEEFYWLVGVTHRGFADSSGEVRNTFGSNISFRADIFEKLDGFNPDIGGRKREKNLQGGETELCARMRETFGQGVWYNPNAKVTHKVFEYRTEFQWLMNRAFWQGYSKRAMNSFVTGTDDEAQFLRKLMTEFLPSRTIGLINTPSKTAIFQYVSLLQFTIVVGLGYLYALWDWDEDTRVS